MLIDTRYYGKYFSLSDDMLHNDLSSNNEDFTFLGKLVPVDLYNFIKSERTKIQKQKIKEYSYRIIIDKYSIVWQLNHPRTDESYKLDYEWIDKIREISNQAELNNLEPDEIDWSLND